MNESRVLKNHLKEIRTEKGLSQSELAQMVGVSRNTISSIETLQFCPSGHSAKSIEGAPRGKGRGRAVARLAADRPPAPKIQLRAF